MSHIEEANVDEGVQKLAMGLYEKYVANAGGKNFLGQPCPAWADLPTAIRDHWCAVAWVTKTIAFDAWNWRSQVDPSAEVPDGVEERRFQQWWATRWRA